MRILLKPIRPVLFTCCGRTPHQFSWRPVPKTRSRLALTGLVTSVIGALAVVACLSSLALVGAASAASIKEIGGGMIQLQAFGETLHFRKADGDDTLFPPGDQCALREYGGIARLSNLLSDRTFRECVATIPDKPDGLVSIIVRPKRDGNYVYPGHVKSDAFPKYAYATDDIDIKLSGFPNYCPQSRMRVRSKICTL